MHLRMLNIKQQLINIRSAKLQDIAWVYYFIVLQTDSLITM